MDYSNDNIIEWNYTEDDIAEKFHFFNELKDGRIHILDPREPGSMKIPPADDPETGVKIKDVRISDKVAARLYLPPSVETEKKKKKKLPLLFYIHGGAFCMYSPFSVDYTRLVTNYVAQFNVIAVAPTYGLFPEHPGAYYEDSWAAFKWVADHAHPDSHVSMLGTSEPWISEYADLNRIFIGGDSGGANITHTMMRNIRKEGIQGNAKVEGIIMVHPYFGDNCKQWMRMNPINEGPEDPKMKPAMEDLANLKCDRVLVFLAEIDPLRPAGDRYVEAIKKSGFKGGLQVVDNKGRHHNFHITKYMDEEAIIINNRIKAFIHNQKAQN